MKKNVTFKNRAINMAGNLYLPNDFSDNKKYVAIVCVHPGSSVKEQTAGIYAGKMAAHGFVTLAFDASYQGERQPALSDTGIPGCLGFRQYFPEYPYPRRTHLKPA